MGWGSFFEPLFKAAGDAASVASEWTSDAFNYVTDLDMPEVVKNGDKVLAKTEGTGLLGDIAAAYTNNPWLGDATMVGAQAYLGERANRDAMKQQRDIYQMKFDNDQKLQQQKFEQDQALLEQKNAMENERYWVQPGTVNQSQYGKSWVTLPQDQQDRTQWRFR